MKRFDLVDSFCLCACVSLFFVMGCGDSSSVKPTKTAKSLVCKSYPSLVNPEISSDAAIAVVNGKPITRADYDSWVALRDIIYGLQNKLDLRVRQDKVIAYRRSARDRVLFDLVRREVLRQESEKRGVVPSASALASAQKTFMKNIHRAEQSYDSFLQSLPQRSREMLVRQIASDVRDEQLLKSWATNDYLIISNQEVSNRLAFVQRHMKTVEEKNAEAKRRAAAAKAEILAGASFYSVTTNRAEIFKEQGKEWDTVELGELDEDSDLFRFLTTAKAGDISDPIDFDDGIGIVGVVLKEMGEVPEGVVPAMQYTLVRCVFNAYEELDEPQNFEAMRKFLRDRKHASVREALVKELAGKAKIEFPYGEELFSRKKKAPAVKKVKHAGRRKKKEGK